MRWLLPVAAALFLLACDENGLVGEACRQHSECAGLERGYCARAEVCTRECSEAAPCPGTTVCSTEGGRSVCLLGCTEDAGCLSGFACQSGRCRLEQPLLPPPDLATTPDAG